VQNGAHNGCRNIAFGHGDTERQADTQRDDGGADDQCQRVHGLAPQVHVDDHQETDDDEQCELPAHPPYGQQRQYDEHQPHGNPVEKIGQITDDEMNDNRDEIEKRFDVRAQELDDPRRDVADIKVRNDVLGGRQVNSHYAASSLFSSRLSTLSNADLEMVPTYLPLSSSTTGTGHGLS